MQKGNGILGIIIIIAIIWGISSLIQNKKETDSVMQESQKIELFQKPEKAIIQKDNSAPASQPIAMDTPVTVSSQKKQVEITLPPQKIVSKTITSYINGEFNGWSGETLYKLDNGEFWQQSEYSYSYDYDYHPKVSVYPSGGGYKMHVYDYDGEDVRVQQIFGVIESKIDGDFNGWEGETVYPLINGQVWQQSVYHYHYHYAYSPKVLIYSSGGGYKMHVDGDSDSEISVRRLK